MTKDPDEDLIEATIRRVAEAKAARAAGASHEPAPEAPAAAPGVSGNRQDGTPPTAAASADTARPAHEPTPASRADDERIAETIRRVAEAKAARAAAAGHESAAEAAAAAPGVVGDRQDGTPTAAASSGGTAQPAHQAAPASLADDERIAETIRRVAEAKTARAAEARAPSAPVVSEPADAGEPPLPPQARITPIRGAEPAASTQPGVDVAGLLNLVAELRQELAATRGDMRELAARFEAAREPAVGAGPPAASDDETWDDTPHLPRIPLGQAPRPAILHDPSPRTATAEHLEPEPETVIDTRPLPKPLPPLHVEPKRGLDLLPRTYRITVEDKRRGVDLVPLHRALLGMDGVRDMSLLSYSNGVAIVAVEMVDELEPQALESAVTRAMSRGAKVEVHNDTTMVVKLAEE